MIQGVIFDIDGTLLDSMSVWRDAASRYLRQIGIEAEPGLDEKIAAMSIEEGAAYIRSNYKLTYSTGQIAAGVDGMVKDFYRHEVLAKDGVTELLKYLQARHIPMTAATSSERPNVEAAFRRLGIDKYIDRVFTCTEVGAGKTRPDIFDAACRFMGGQPSSIWVFEDAYYALMTAKSAGYRTVGVYDKASENDWEDIKKNTDLYMEQPYNPDEFWDKASFI